MKKRRVWLTIGLLLIIGAYALFQIDEANKPRFLQNYLQEHHALSDSSYSSHASITQFGTMFHVTLVDEPDIMYDFFVKQRDGVMHVVYSFNLEQGHGLRDREFETVNYAILDTLFK
ncbi:hypothetical protein [Exiguobacterium sp. s56]|uniref:hypothetical protein n=1 Tax=Exiguobacterium sp. s56 TaxID=2751232 RepID=UPI001BE9DF20|nr:hypothetical protein [Exiguobacterium sp. s56]